MTTTATTTAMHQHPDGWAGFPWPMWVPVAVRVQVEDIWATPAAWRRNSATMSAPPLGTDRHVTTPTGAIHIGQYVHIRGAVGRLITPWAGTSTVVRLEAGQLQWAGPA